MARILSAQSAVATAMIGYVRSAFRLRTFGTERLHTEAGTIVAPSHRSDNDPPVLAATTCSSEGSSRGGSRRCPSRSAGCCSGLTSAGRWSTWGWSPCASPGECGSSSCS